MRHMETKAVVHFMNQDAPRDFPSLRDALAFLAVYCPANLAETAWIEMNGERVEISETRTPPLR